MRVLRRARRLYGASPSHLFVLAACFALVVYAVSHLVENPSFTRMVSWFVVAVIAHDLVLFPGYALGDRLLTAGSTVLRRVRWRLPFSPVNHLRVPILGSGLLLLLFFPGIIEQGSVWYRAATGQTQEPFSQRWLLITAVMFGASALVYALRVGIAYWPETKAGLARLKKKIGAALGRRDPGRE
ncbi:hypothetical protein FHX42_002935 [Saccharopolyspora lacisalsi]|uniref:Lipoprotein n=1 Tax=Halosaccharopolyspora lacisalsi TaxID=1000566 RepID=A0A839DXW3_9PSEU|nr:hypothetical protein [Halosaccharopolyspora lacisalsi]MBA8825569.1 hypothetical protein [Halosaccharopolyspora lacisalsi]